MNKRTKILVAITFLLGLRVAANAETLPEINVTLPFEFVACKTTLPGGKYIVKRTSDQPFDILMINSNDNSTSVFVNPIAMENAFAYKPNVSFRTVGDQHFLSGIQAADYVYNFRVSGSVTLAAAAEPTRHRLCSRKLREQLDRLVALSHGVSPTHVSSFRSGDYVA